MCALASWRLIIRAGKRGWTSVHQENEWCTCKCAKFTQYSFPSCCTWYAEFLSHLHCLFFFFFKEWIKEFYPPLLKGWIFISNLALIKIGVWVLCLKWFLKYYVWLIWCCVNFILVLLHGLFAALLSSLFERDGERGHLLPFGKVCCLFLRKGIMRTVCSKRSLGKSIQSRKSNKTFPCSTLKASSKLWLRVFLVIKDTSMFNSPSQVFFVLNLPDYFSYTLKLLASITPYSKGACTIIVCSAFCSFIPFS